MPIALSAAIFAGLVVVSTAVGLVWRARTGRLREQPDGDALTTSDIGADFGARATLVQFSSAFCQPCRATRVVLGEVVKMLDGVTHVEIDAETHLDLVRRLQIMRTPTVLVLDRSGRIVRRASGAPRKAEVLATLANVSPELRAK